MKVDFSKSICNSCINKKQIKGLGAKDLLGRSAPLLFDGAFCKKINGWIPEIKDNDGKIYSDISECDGFKVKKK